VPTRTSANALGAAGEKPLGDECKCVGRKREAIGRQMKVRWEKERRIRMMMAMSMRVVRLSFQWESNYNTSLEKCAAPELTAQIRLISIICPIIVSRNAIRAAEYGLLH
jgi:hypothetical protein